MLRKLVNVLVAVLLSACGGGGGPSTTAPVSVQFAALHIPETVFFGDSTMNGAGGIETPVVVAQRLLRQWTGDTNLILRNEAWSGTGAHHLLPGTDGAGLPWDERLVAVNPERVVIAHSHNDTRGTAAEFRHNVRELVRIAKARGIEVVLQTSNPVLVPGAGLEAASAEFAQVVREISAEMGAGLCDVYQAFISAGMARQEFYIDHVHLTTVGYTFMGRTMAECLIGSAR